MPRFQKATNYTTRSDSKRAQKKQTTQKAQIKQRHQQTHTTQFRKESNICNKPTHTKTQKDKKKHNWPEIRWAATIKKGHSQRFEHTHKTQLPTIPKKKQQTAQTARINTQKKIPNEATTMSNRPRIQTTTKDTNGPDSSKPRKAHIIQHTQIKNKEMQHRLRFKNATKQLKEKKGPSPK